VCDEVATVMDLLPTCAALAGGRPPGAPLDGRDITALLERPDTATSPHDVLPYYNAARLEAVRAGRWKLWLEKRERPPEGDEVVKPCRLYDLAADVGEARDVAADHPDVVAALKAAAKAARIPSATTAP
jgi:arylsulfatase